MACSTNPEERERTQCQNPSLAGTRMQAKSLAPDHVRRLHPKKDVDVDELATKQ